ncbi:MAG: Omp28-related outer membrane protein [Rikenellaceae bacterium]
MKQKKLLRPVITAALFLGFALSSCSETSDDSSTQQDQGTKPSIEISNVAASNESVTFTITPTDAIQYKYSVAPVGDDHSYTTVMSSKEGDITVSKLTNNVEYQISAYAYSIDDVESDEAEATFTTEAIYTYDRMCVAYKFTATWCTVCPYMTSALDSYIESNPSSLAIVALHQETSSAMGYNTTWGDELFDDWGLSSLPTTIIDYRQSCDYTVSSIEGAVNTSNDYATTCDAAITSKVEDGVVYITVDSKFGATARYKIAVILTENNLYEGNTSGSDDGYYHHVARAFCTEAFGDAFGSIELGGTRTDEFEYTLDSSWIVDEMEVTVVLLKEESTNKYYANNVAVSPINGSVDFK